MTTRVHQLADELGLSKFELIDKINSLDLDISVDNAMSALSDEEVARLKRALKLDTFDPQPVLGVWRLESLTRGKRLVRSDQTHLVIQEAQLWPVRPAHAEYVTKPTNYEYELEWKDDAGQLTVRRPGEEIYRGLLQVDTGELRIRWAKDGGDFRHALKSGFPRSMNSGGTLAVYRREDSPEVTEQLSAGGLLPQSWALTFEAIELCDEGRHEEALELFDRAIEIDPHLAVAFVQRGMAHMDRGDFTSALVDFDRAVELDEHLIGARQARAQCLEDLGESEKAAEERQRVEREEELEWIEAADGLGASTK